MLMGLSGGIRQNIIKEIKKNRKNVRAVEQKEKHGIFEAALLCPQATI
jgi:hypothetical protein